MQIDQLCCSDLYVFSEDRQEGHLTISIRGRLKNTSAYCDYQAL